MNSLVSQILKILEEGDHQSPRDKYLFAKLVEVAEGTETPLCKPQFILVPILSEWGYCRYLRYMRYGSRLKALKLNLDADLPTITVSLAQSEEEMAMMRIIEHAAAADDPVAAMSAALSRMFPAPSA